MSGEDVEDGPDGGANSFRSSADAIPDADDVVTPDDVRAARDRIVDVVERTPLDRSRTFGRPSGAESVGLKLETFQRTGSFKLRGAYNRMAPLSPAERERDHTRRCS